MEELVVYSGDLQHGDFLFTGVVCGVRAVHMARQARSWAVIYLFGVGDFGHVATVLPIRRRCHLVAHSLKNKGIF